MDRGAWWATVHGVTKRWTRLNDLLLSGTGKELKLEWEQSQVNSKYLNEGFFTPLQDRDGYYGWLLPNFFCLFFFFFFNL